VTTAAITQTMMVPVMGLGLRPKPIIAAAVADIPIAPSSSSLTDALLRNQLQGILTHYLLEVNRYYLLETTRGCRAAVEAHRVTRPGAPAVK
jgi:hypothetical protein